MRAHAVFQFIRTKMYQMQAIGIFDLCLVSFEIMSPRAPMRGVSQDRGYKQRETFCH